MARQGKQRRPSSPQKTSAQRVKTEQLPLKTVDKAI
jgi:hypothetical protein